MSERASDEELEAFRELTLEVLRARERVEEAMRELEEAFSDYAGAKEAQIQALARVRLVHPREAELVTREAQRETKEASG